MSIHKKPPQLAAWFLEHFRPRGDIDLLLGDLEEEYHEQVDWYGPRRARFWYWTQVFKSTPGLTLDMFSWSVIMFKNYFKVTLRNLRRHKGYSFINIAGLSVGLACAILIFWWVQDELSYDRFHKHGHDIYQIIRIGSVDPTAFSSVLPLPLIPTIKEEIPEVIAAPRFMHDGRHFVRYEDQANYQSGAVIVDDDFFRMFSFRFIKGDASFAFSDPYSVVITQKMANAFFGEDEPVGKVITIDNQNQFTVTGVIENPHHSHLNFDYIFTFRLLEATGTDMDEWHNVSFMGYVHLYENSSLDQVKAKISNSIRRHVPEYSGIRVLQPLTNIHYSRIRGFVISFSAIALIILVIACINFMNLSTARSGYRAKEISMRKVIGARRSDVVKQVFGESFFLTFLASVVAILLVVLCRPGFEAITGKRLVLEHIVQIHIIAGFAAITLITGLLSGLYPALLFSSFQPIHALKNSIHGGLKKGGFRKGLVIVQFTLSIILILSTIVVSRQLNVLMNKELGYDKENILYVRMQGAFSTNVEAIKDDLIAHPNIQAVTLINLLPNMYGWGTDSPTWEGKQDDQRVQFTVRSVDTDFLHTFAVEMVEGRFFTNDISMDLNSFVLNESAVSAIGLESPVGKWFEYHWIDKKGPIIGVVKDFHFASLHNEIEPLIMMVMPSEYNYMCLKIKSTDISLTIADLEKTWKTYVPDFAFEYHFLDQSLENLYQTEQRLATIIRIFSIIAILVSCLGLLGLISFLVEQRTKEIGVRKVLGASLVEIVVLFTKEFTKWVIISNVIAWPIAYYVLNQWLRDYPYHTKLSWWIFVLSGSSALFIAVVTIAYQVFRAAMINPVDSLRYE